MSLMSGESPVGEWISYQRNDNFTVGSGLEVVLVLEVLSNQTMVVNFTVDSEDDGVIRVGKGLSTRLCIKG